MHETFFKLRKKPFELVPDPEFIYLSRSHKKALTYLDYGIRERAGFILLTGDVGSGKTTLIRNLLAKKYDRLVLAKVFITRVTSEQLLTMINDDFGLAVAGKDKVSLIRDLNDFLLDQYAAGNHPVLIIDEAQNLAADLLEEIRMLSNLESSRSKLLQIVLVGQPELRETLAAPEMLQLRQRIGINCHLKALSREEVAQYIVHRMTVAGNGEALKFPADTLNLVFHYSRGIPRLINIICDFLMLCAFAEKVTTISLELARDVVGDLDFEQHFWGGAKTQSQASPQLPPEAADRDHASLEKASAERITSALNDVCAVISQLKQDFSAHLVKGDAEISELNKSVTTLGDALQRIGVQASQIRPVEAGFVRRLFGSAAMNGNK